MTEILETLAGINLLNAGLLAKMWRSGRRQERGIDPESWWPI